MSSRPTPPPEAELVLTYPTAERTPEFIEVVTRGFYDTYQADLWEPGRALFEPDRNFGFTVDDRWISTAGVYSRRLTVPGGAVPVAAVTFVTVNPSYRRRGLLRQMMTHQLADIQRRGTEPVALLWASEAAIYGRFGYGHAGPKLHLSGDTRRSAFRPEITPRSGSVGEVDRDTYAEIAPVLHQRWLAQRPGALDRTPPWWTLRVHDPEPWRGGASPQRYACTSPTTGNPTDMWRSGSRGASTDPRPRLGSPTSTPTVPPRTPACGGSSSTSTWSGPSSARLPRSTTRYATCWPMSGPSRLS